MNETYSDDIMLCYIQGFNNGTKNNGTRAIVNPDTCEDNNNVPKKKEKRVSLQLNLCERVEEVNSDITKYPKTLIKGNSIKLSVGDRARKLPVVKRSFSDRFSRITDVSGRRPKNILTIRKTWSTGNFPAGAAGGGCGAPRSAPATPLQLEPHPPRHVKAEKTHVVKPLSGSAPSVRVAALGGAEDTTDEKQPYKSRQKKFQRHFPQVGPEERVLNYYSCALVGDLLLQGHLYITKNYFAFYSNVFGYVTKLLIPTTSVLRITKEKVARIIPNAVGVCTRDERHVFGSLLSRDSTYKLMTHVWKAARATEPDIPKSKDLRTDHEPSEYSPEDDSSSAGGDHDDAPAPPVRRESEAIITGSAAVIQPALLTGTTSPPEKPSHWRTFLIAATIVLSLSALVMAYRLFVIGVQTEDDIMGLSGDDLYEELVKYRTRLHGRAANEMHAFLTTNLLLLTKVRQSLEALSGVILSDLSRADDLHVDLDVPNDTAFS